MGDLVSITSGTGRRRGMLRGPRAADLYDRGCALEAAGRIGEAISAYERALAGRPDFADAHNNLGKLVHERGELGRAESHYRLAACADPGVALYWFNLGVVVEDRGGEGAAAEACAAYERALALDPGFADAHYNLARLYDTIGRRTNDELTLRRAVHHFTRYKRRSEPG